MSHTRKVLAHHLRFLRFSRGWTQEQLAAASGLHRTYISAVERAQRNVGLDNVERLAAAFGLSVNELLDFQSVSSTLLDPTGKPG